MTSAPPSATAPAPKKRSFFKKAAWQTDAKPEGEENKDMFSHSGEYAEIVAEEARRKKAEKARLKKEEESKKMKIEEENRRTRLEEENRKRKATGESGRKKRKVGNEESFRMSSPESPLPGTLSFNEDTLSSRYESLTKSSSPARPTAKKLSEVIDLGSSSDSDSNDVAYKPTRQQTVARLPSQPVPTTIASDEDIEEVESTLHAELAAKARARTRARAANQTTNGAAQEEPPGPIVQLLIDTHIPDTKQLLIKVRSSTTLDKPRKAWCSKQGYTDRQSDSVFLTWKRHRLFDSTKVERCGIRIDANGNVTMEGSTDLFTDDDLPKVHLEAWTDKVFQDVKKQEADEEIARRKADEVAHVRVEEPTPEPEPAQRKIRLFLKARGKADFKISVKPETTFEHLTAAYRQRLDIPDTQPLTLMFDGDRLRPMDTIQDADIDDMDAIEVHYK